jgi:Ni,Fe-hydrogenase maturation factor
MKTVYVFGNEYIKEDSFAKILAKKLKNVKIVNATTPDVLLDAKKDIIILDVVKGIQEPMLIKDINQLKTRNLMSLHDFDVGFFLKLMEHMGIKKNVTIIGVPEEGDIDAVSTKIKQWLF